jgi:transposase
MTETEAKWFERVREWRSSGKTAEQFAEGRGFEPTTLRYWASRLTRAKASSAESDATPSVRMVRVERAGGETSTAPAIVIGIGAARIEVHAGVDLALLGEVVAALGGGR